MEDNETIKLEINGREVTAPAGITVLRAAELNGIYIPTLCSHKDLSPFGGCRLCIVEIEGIRGYPLSCYTTAANGMKVRTDTVAIQDIRREVLQLILSEHPASCLICPESEECKNFMGTVRKAGVTSGCRYCPNDNQCELQEVVKKLEVTDINYPIYYRGFETERSDPFYDRDYNICILCGRCVRMCQEMRGTAVLAFNWRGPKATVGPAFGRNHIEAGCEFCGACVAVCPTGALAEKASKWDGKPDGMMQATCPYCAIGCRLELWHKDGRFSKAIPVVESPVNDGQACLKGRFCMGEVSHHFERARKPMMRQDDFWKEVTWDEALDKVTEKLKGLQQGEFAMVISPDCTNESLYVAQKFTRMVMGTNSIDSTARWSLGGDIGLWARLFRKPISIQSIKKSTRILAIGLDTRFNFSIIGVEIRKALQKGAKLVTVDPRDSNLARYADVWLQPHPGMEGAILYALIKGMEGKKAGFTRTAENAGVDEKALEDATKLLKAEGLMTVVLGPAVFRYSANRELIKSLVSLTGFKDANIIPLYNGANTRGVIEMGALPEMLPGAQWTGDENVVETIEEAWGGKLPADKGITVDELISGHERPKVLYLVGAVPFFKRPDCDFLIVQDIYEPDFDVDLFLPASSFLEAAGTLINVEGRVQDSPRLEKLPESVIFGRSRPDWWTLIQLAGKLGAKGFNYETEDDILNEIAPLVRGFPTAGAINRMRRTVPYGRNLPKPVNVPIAVTPSGVNFLLVVHPGGYTHRGIDMIPKVEGLQILNPEEGFHLNPEDAAKIGVSEGENIIVKAGSISASAPARLHPELPRGVIYLYMPEASGGLSNRASLEPLFRLAENPCPVEVSKDAV